MKDDETAVEVLIYRSERGGHWVLEVVDEEPASTLWDDPFPTDQAAFDVFLKTVEEEGILTFLEDDSQSIH